MSECNHDCGNCSQNCDSRKPESLLENLNELSSVKKVIGVVSGKGGVGKSLVTSMLSVLLQRMDKHVAILDADITGPSIPKAFGITEKATANEFGIIPCRSKTGIDIMSLNLLLPHDTDPVIWRGPVIAGTVKQCWTETIWKNIDCMFIDMPPGTGDVPLTVFQSIPVDGIVIVTSPQELVSMIVEKAVNMAKLMNIPILGIVENMSYVECPDCGKQIKVFGESHIEETAKALDLPVLGKIPMDPAVASCCDKGLIELFEGNWLDDAANKIYDML